MLYYGDIHCWSPVIDEQTSSAFSQFMSDESERANWIFEWSGGGITTKRRLKNKPRQGWGEIGGKKNTQEAKHITILVEILHRNRH